MESSSGLINKMGVELEGLWSYIPHNERLEDDGSVEFDDGGDNYIGEIVSSKHDTLEGLLEWVRRTYPDETNETCGMHIHISLNTKLAYSQLMSDKFNRYFMRQVRKWAKQHNITDENFWNRFNGNNDYCYRVESERDFDGQVQATDKGGDRYKMLNFTFNYLGTLECRLFPAFGDPSESLKAIRLFHDIVDSYLVKQPKYEKAKIIQVVDPTLDQKVVEALCV